MVLVVCVFVTCSCSRLVFLFVFFFFKQKTAYEMRISDWSSDVCSSDLLGAGEREIEAGARIGGVGGERRIERAHRRFRYLAVLRRRQRLAVGRLDRKSVV